MNYEKQYTCMYVNTLSINETYHDVEVDVFTSFLSRKERQVLGLQLVWVVQHGPRIEASLHNWDIVFDP